MTCTLDLPLYRSAARRDVPREGEAAGHLATVAFVVLIAAAVVAVLALSLAALAAAGQPISPPTS